VAFWEKCLASASTLMGVKIPLPPVTDRQNPLVALIFGRDTAEIARAIASLVDSAPQANAAQFQPRGGLPSAMPDSKPPFSE
jgi:hypothetical protein